MNQIVRQILVEIRKRARIGGKCLVLRPQNITTPKDPKAPQINDEQSTGSVVKSYRLAAKIRPQKFSLAQSTHLI
jgi:hypothetical protein